MKSILESKRIGYLVLFLGIVGLVFGNCGNKEETTEPVQIGKITGTVYDSQKGIPIQKVSITTQPPSGSVTTDTSGFYSIVDTTPDVYTVAATKLGYENATADIKVMAGQTTIADIVMKPDTLNR